jgi:hypothetical protein
MRAAPVAEYAIILEKWLAIHQKHWPLTKRGPSLESMRLETQHDDRFTLVRRTEKEAHLAEAKTLLNSRTGETDDGGIYELI